MNGKISAERRFVVDNMLGKMAKWLRVLGFDVIYERLSRQEQLDKYKKEGRVLITRNQRWRRDPSVICLIANDPMEQLRDVISMLGVTPGEVRLLHRCILCNEPLRLLTREEAFASAPDYVFATNAAFHACPRCHRTYWPGSHSKRMMQRLQELLDWSL